MKNLLIVTAVIEVVTGLVLVAIPTLLATILLGSSLDSPVELIVMRVAGVALLALGLACWFARLDGESRTTRGLVTAMVVYNAGIVTLLTLAGIGSGLSSIGLWAIVLLHTGLTIWCLTCLLKKPA